MKKRLKVSEVSLSYSVWSRLIGAAPGHGGCPIQRPLMFDLIYTDYHGLAHLHGAMGLAFNHYKYDDVQNKDIT